MKQNLLLIFLAAISIFLLAIFLKPQNISLEKANSTIVLESKTKQIESVKNLCINTDSVEQVKEAWAILLANHPYNLRENMVYEDWKAIPKTDRPDLAREQDFLMTMDPSTASVPYENLLKTNSAINTYFDNQKAAISGVNWTERGPDNVGGRTRALMFDPNDATAKKVWAGGVAGGLWYTNDITITSPVWNHVDNFWDNIAVSCIAYDPSNTQIMYVGTGEGFYNADAVKGGGIWKTTDGGATWNLLNSTTAASTYHFEYVNKIVVKANGHVFAATRTSYSNAGGILKSTDGGASWTRVLTMYVSGSGTVPFDRAADIEIAANGDLYVSFGIGFTGGVFKSTDANDGNLGTWIDLSASIVMGGANRIELACAPSDANIIYAVAAGGSGSVDTEWFKKSIDGGATWSSITIPLMVDGTGNHFTRGQAWYDLILAVHPTDANLVIAGGIDLHRTTNGGTSWSGISHWYGGFGYPEVHADQHSMQFRPGFSDQMIFGHDGGIDFSTNAGNSSATPSFDNKNTGYNVTQFYACATKNDLNSNYFLAGAQDNGSHQFNNPAINSTTEVTGGDGAFCHIDQLNSDIQLTSYVYNNLYRSLNGGASFTRITTDYDGLFINPSEYDNQRKILYSTGDDDKLKVRTGIDGSITTYNDNVSIGTAQISALKIDEANDVLVFGVENGRVYTYSNASSASGTLTRIDNGTTPITTSGWVSSIDIGVNYDTILVTYSNYGVTSVWETTDGGTNWYSKEGNLPDIPIRWGLYNPRNKNEVLLATEAGVWSCDNFQTGTSGAPVWAPTNSGLANVRCDMLKYREIDGTVVVATHGRGLYTTDAFDITSLPIKLLSFTAECNSNQIDFEWITVSELNNDYFVLEKSVDGINFDEITQIAGAGNSNMELNYIYSYNKNDDANYFRLKQVDFDGNFSYSGIIYSNCTNEMQLVISPNPSNGIFTIEGFGENAELSIFNTSSELVYKEKIENNRANINISDLTKGLYIVQIKTGDVVVVEKVVVE